MSAESQVLNWLVFAIGIIKATFSNYLQFLNTTNNQTKTMFNFNYFPNILC